MGNFYTGLASTAAKLLADKGQLITFTRKTLSSFDPIIGKETLGTATTYTGNGAAFDYKASELVDGLIQKGDIKLLLEATTTAPLIDDTCVIDSVTYRVMDVITTSPAGTVVIYTLQLRK